MGITTTDQGHQLGYFNIWELSAANNRFVSNHPRKAVRTGITQIW